MEKYIEFKRFSTDFIIGTDYSDIKQTDIKEVFFDWHKYFTKSYIDKKIQFVAFLNEINIEDLKSIINELMIQYHSKYPHSNKQNFLDHYFDYTLYQLGVFIEREYQFICTCPKHKNYAFYGFYHKIDREYIHYAIPSTKDIDYFKQYFHKVITTIEGSEYINSDMPDNLVLVNNKDDLKNLEKLIFSDDIIKFREIEQRLIESEWIIKEKEILQWVKKKVDLIDFCRVLKKEKISRPHAKISKLISFFEERYCIDTGDQKKPSKYSKRQLKAFNYNFFFE
jgi:hypothetical protein